MKIFEGILRGKKMGDNCSMENENGNGDYVTFSCRLEKDLLLKIDDLRSERRPIPSRMEILKELIIFAVEQKQKEKK